jgi:hypothetical protein
MTAPPAPLTFLAAAEQVLGEAGTPLTTQAITERALAAKLVATQAKTPAATMESQLAGSVQKHGETRPFVGLRIHELSSAMARCWAAPAVATAHGRSRCRQ